MKNEKHLGNPLALAVFAGLIAIPGLSYVFAENAPDNHMHIQTARPVLDQGCPEGCNVVEDFDMRF